MKWLILIALLQRTYWPVPLATLSHGTLHTHVETRGQVAYVRSEGDGDTHIKIVDPLNPSIFIIAECIPQLPCIKPRVGSAVVIRGISRHDPEHGWWEIHPVESWEYTLRTR